jgi:hypothetical protein
MEKSKYLEWLEGITDVVEESTASRRESATSAFWKALAARHDKVVFEEQQGRGQHVRHVKQRKDPMNQHLVHLGHLVDEVTSTFTCAKATQIALLYILNISTWHVQMCIPQSRSPFASSPFLLVTPPSKNVLYIVDLNFNEKFQAARQSRRLKGLLKSLPKAFVGTHSNLAKCLSWCSSIVQESFLMLGITIPPWRTGKHLQEIYTSYKIEVMESCLRQLDKALHTAAHKTVNTGVHLDTTALHGEAAGEAPRLSEVAKDMLHFLQAGAKAEKSAEANAAARDCRDHGALQHFIEPSFLKSFVEHLQTQDHSNGRCLGTTCSNNMQHEGGSEFEKHNITAPEENTVVTPSSLTQMMKCNWPPGQRPAYNAVVGQ